MRVVVADASALLEYLLGADASDAMKEAIRIADIDLHVPALCDVEVAAGLRRALMGKALSHERAEVALRDYKDLPLTRHGHLMILERMFELRANFSVYDATYVALAERLSAELLTADGRLTRAVGTHTDIAILG